MHNVESDLGELNTEKTCLRKEKQLRPASNLPNELVSMNIRAGIKGYWSTLKIVKNHVYLNLEGSWYISLTLQPAAKIAG